MKFLRRRSGKGEPPRPVVPPEIEAMLSHVEPLERQVLLARFGLDAGSPRTFEEAAAVLNMPVEEVERIEAAAVARLRAARGEGEDSPG